MEADFSGGDITSNGGVLLLRQADRLSGLMTAAGWDFYRNEWWHYQLFDSRRYPRLDDADLPEGMM